MGARNQVLIALLDMYKHQKSKTTKKAIINQIDEINRETMLNCPFPDINGFSGTCNKCGKVHDMIFVEPPKE